MSHVGATRPGVLNLPTNPHHSLQHHTSSIYCMWPLLVVCRPQKPSGKSHPATVNHHSLQADSAWSELVVDSCWGLLFYAFLNIQHRPDLCMQVCSQGKVSGYTLLASKLSLARAWYWKMGGRQIGNTSGSQARPRAGIGFPSTSVQFSPQGRMVAA